MSSSELETIYRNASGIIALRLKDIYWDRMRFLVHSQKTRRYPGHETRIVPIFAELETLFRERFEQAAEGESLVLPFLVGRSDASLRRVVERAINRAGVKVWKRLWHNLRGTRQNELEELGFTAKSVRHWLGNSKDVASRHYEKLTEKDFEKAVGPIVKTPEKRAANALRQPAATR